MKFYPVDSIIKSSANDTPACIVPIQTLPQQHGLGFPHRCPPAPSDADRPRGFGRENFDGLARQHSGPDMGCIGLDWNQCSWRDTPNELLQLITTCVPRGVV